MQVNLHIITLSGKPVSGVWVTNDAEKQFSFIPGQFDIPRICLILYI